MSNARPLSHGTSREERRQAFVRDYLAKHGKGPGYLSAANKAFKAQENATSPIRRADDGHAVTIAAPPCKPDHPPYSLWARRDLARGICPWCGCHIGNDPKVARALQALDLIGEN
jgi:hypothetical protein